MADREQRIEDLDARYLMCRALFHPWAWITDQYPLQAKAGFYHVVSQCSRCGMVKTELMSSRSFEPRETSYSNRPDNYGSGRKGEPFSKKDCKKELLRRRLRGLI